MTKTEFSDQFKRLRVAGYRLPVFDGITIKDVIDEWFKTFGSCTVEEFSQAIDRLKQGKQDTFWPATGELWAHVFEVRKARRIRLQGQMPTDHDIPAGDRQELAAMFRTFAQQLGQRMTMPKAVAQEEPQAIQDARTVADEDAAASR